MQPWLISRPFAVAVCGSLLLHASLWSLVGHETAGSQANKKGHSSPLMLRLDFKAGAPVANVSVNGNVASPPGSQGLNESTPDGISAHTLQPGLVQVHSSPFYPAEQLTVRPKVIAEVELETPDTRRMAASGDIVLQVLIDDRGDVAGVEVEASSLPEIFSQTVSNAFRNFKFTPGEIGGLAVRSVMRVEISFNDAALPKHAQ